MPRRFTSILSSAISRRWNDRRSFASLGAWSIVLYDTLLRFAKRWPLPGRGRPRGVRLEGLAEPVEIRLGTSDGFVLEEIFLRKVYEPAMALSADSVRQVIDLGANCGLSVRLWLASFPNCKLVAVEPDAGNYEALLGNVRRSGQADRVQCIRACVAAQAGEVYLDRSREECAITMIPQPMDQSDSVPAVPMSRVLSECEAEAIDLLKVDIEGAEQEVFVDCREWLGRVGNLFIELHPPYTADHFLADLQRNGGRFTIVWRGETAGNPLLFLRAEASAGK